MGESFRLIRFSNFTAQTAHDCPFFFLWEQYIIDVDRTHTDKSDVKNGIANLVKHEFLAISFRPEFASARNEVLAVYESRFCLSIGDTPTNILH